MQLEKILIVDDSKENRDAARIAIPNAEFAQSAAEAIDMLQKNQYDLVITDMQMETPTAGLSVVTKAFERNVLPYVLSRGGPSHQGTTTHMRPYGGDICNKESKTSPATWVDALDRIQNPGSKDQPEFLRSAQIQYHKVLEKIRESGRSVTLPKEVITALYFPFF